MYDDDQSQSVSHIIITIIATRIYKLYIYMCTRTRREKKNRLILRDAGEDYRRRNPPPPSIIMVFYFVITVDLREIQTALDYIISVG